MDQAFERMVEGARKPVSIRILCCVFRVSRIAYHSSGPVRTQTGADQTHRITDNRRTSSRRSYGRESGRKLVTAGQHLARSERKQPSDVRQPHDIPLNRPLFGALWQLQMAWGTKGCRATSHARRLTIYTEDRPTAGKKLLDAGNGRK